MNDYQSHDAVGLAALVRSGDVTPAELLAAARARVAEVNPRINAVVREIEPPAAGEGPFAGVPFLLKDLHQDLAGHPTSDGSRALAATRRTETATAVQRWLDAGLVVFGKTNTPEFGAKGVTEPVVFGPARNPWNTGHTPGGSSGGAAAAVAAGIVPCAAASDGGGSIRIPASACGLFGLKPSRGLVPAGPAVGEGIGGTATNGVISRSVRDTAAMLDVLVGATPESPYLPALPAGPYADEVGRDPGTLRIGVCTASAINPDPHPEALAAARSAAELLAGLGHHVEELDAAPGSDRGGAPYGGPADRAGTRRHRAR
jgi:Asp-tRNA(Asn)/Glu-tRNA(Gln) amidotransferase A subunit family amidase